MERRKIEKGKVDDLVLLDEPSERAIVDNLRATSKDDRIYTWIGPVLISVNPFRNISGLYAPALLRKYRNRHTWELAPHVYAVAEDAYASLMATHTNQCILISGESGAGKTEAAKKVMEYVAAVSPLAAASDVNAKDRLLESNPVLEAFGNAKTIRNNNSSRFGKYMELVFDYAGRPMGGRISNYLLEKPRVTSPAADERSFHIFYFLLAGANAAERSDLRLGSPDSYAMLVRSHCTTVAGLNDRDEYIQVRAAMTSVGFSLDEQLAYMRLVAAILSLGNIEFGGGGAGNKPHAAKAGGGKEALQVAASLLGTEAALLERSLTHRTITSGMESVTSPLPKAEECVQTAEAFAKALYSRMFLAVVKSINAVIEPPSGLSLTMGVLDIYGFEIFEVNSFEQLCINYCNEKLQQFFIELTLRSEQAEYASEGIDWVQIDFFNNKTVCELIEGKRPPGVLAYLDEESLVPQGTDASLLAKMQAQLKHEHFKVADSKTQALRGGAGGADLFTIVHYAGAVQYSPAGLLEKNKDTLFRDLLVCGGASKAPLIASLFPEAKEKAHAGKRPLTASTQFRNSMAELVATLSRCAPHYIRTIKPNDAKRAGIFDTDRVASQVRYLGLLENVRVRRAGFAFRQSFELFASRFRLLSPQCWPTKKHAGDSRDEVLIVLRESGIGKDAYELGKTKLFLRAPITLFALEELRKRKCSDVARMIQAAWRSYRARKYFMELRERAKGIFMGQKRRRGSWSLYFIGDYIGASDSADLTRLLSKYGESRVLFADVVEKVNRNRKVQPRALVISEASVYTCTPGKYKETNRVPMNALTGVSLSTFADGYMVLHVREGTKGVPADLLVTSVRKAEILTILVSEFQLRGAELKLSFSDLIKYRSKKSGGFFTSGLESRTLQFIEDASLGRQAAVARLEEAGVDKAKMVLRVSPILGSLAPVQLETTRLSHGEMRVKRRSGFLAKMRGADSASKPPAQPQVAWSAAAKPPPAAMQRTGSRGLASGGGSGGGAYGQRVATPPPPRNGGYAPNYANHPAPGGHGGGSGAPKPKFTPKPPPPRPTSAKRASFSSFPQAQAMWEYKISAADELGFKAGEVLRILEMNGEWWSAANSQGKTGSVPSNYLQML